jgi:hypothetical protein
MGVGLGWHEAAGGAFCARTKNDPHKTKPNVNAVLSKRMRRAVFIVFLELEGTS